MPAHAGERGKLEGGGLKRYARLTMRTLMIVTTFAAGLAAGWLLHAYRQPDSGSVPPVMPAPPERRAPPAQSPDLAALLRAGRFDGLLARLGTDSGKTVELMKQARPAAALALAERFNEAHGERFPVVMAMADVEAGRGNYREAVALLLRAALLIDTSTQQARLDAQLERVTDEYARELTAREAFHTLDSMYQSITLALPEQAEYFVKLGKLRMRMGNFEQALVPLSHIENHRQWGERARELIAQAEASEVLETAGEERLTLRRQGHQFVVQAVLDRGTTVELLIDTGAAMTVIDAALLERLGYRFEDHDREYFATANGVVEAPVVTIDHLRLGSAGIDELPVGALQLDMPNGIQGLLGMNFLRHYQFRIDQARNVLYLDRYQ